jgi:hypothetical protein
VDNILIGLVAIAIGAVVGAYGARGFFLLLPLWGFLAGFSVGAQAIAYLFGEALLATVTGWIAGLVVGVAFALLAGLWWWAAIVILAGLVGFKVGSGLLVAIGLEPGLLPFGAGIALGVLFAVAAILLDAPTLLVAAFTAFGGAAYAVAGAYLMLRQISIDELRDGPVGALADHPVGIVAWLGIGAILLGFQYLDTRRIGYDRIERNRYRVV